MKQHAIIEKTARFIASQGMQMEILLKAKQSNNAQFEFLTQNSLLNPYYKFMLEAMKNGNYPEENITDQVKTENVIASNEAGGIQDEERIDATKTQITIPTVKYTPSENCAYTQLISKIKGVPLQDVISEGNKERVQTPSPVIAVSENVPQNADGSPKVEVLKNTSALALAQNYDSDTESEEEERVEEKQFNFPIPLDNVRNIIDKTATYVIKNGRKFEETLRSKDEERFKFLLPENEFYAYYLYKVTGDADAASKEQKTRKAAAVAAAVLSRKGLIRGKTASPTPVSFTIKAKDETPVSTLTAALPQDASDEEEGERADALPLRNPNLSTLNLNTRPRQVPEQVQKAIQMIENQLMARNALIVNTALTQIAVPLVNAAKPTVLTTNPIKATSHMNNKSEQERNAQFEQKQQNRQREMKRAEEKVKDKLTQIAREKLCGLISKEKQLQQERKRKAIAFLHNIKNSPPGESETILIANTQPTENDKEPSVVNNTIPISSYGPLEVAERAQSTNTNLSSTTSTTPPLKGDEVDTTVTVVSDDDDVELVSETKPQIDNFRRSRSHSPSGSRSRSRSRSRISSRAHKRNCADRSDHEKGRRHRHKSSHNGSKKKKKSRKRDRESRSPSRSRSRSHHRRSQSHSRSKSKRKKNKTRH